LKDLFGNAESNTKIVIVCIHVFNEDVLFILNNQRMKNQILSTKQENVFSKCEI